MTKLIVPLTCAAIAGVAIAAALLTDQETRTEKPQPTVIVPESAGVRWNSLDLPAQLRIVGDGDYWLALRAFAHGRPTRLALQADDGTRLAVRVGTEPAIHLVGPVTIRRAAAYRLTSSPRAANGPGLLLSGFRLVRQPLAALPAAGFWPTSPADPADSNWLNGHGTVEVASSSPATRRFRLRFEVVSADRGRTLTVSQGRTRFRVAIPGRGDKRDATVGPFELRAGRADLRFAAPGAVVLGGDSRPRSVRVSDLEASPVSP